MDEKAYDCWLHSVLGIGNKTAVFLVKKLGSSRAVYEASEKTLGFFLREKQTEAIREAKRQKEPKAVYEQMLVKGIRMVCFYETDYPKRLRQIDNLPFAVYYLGRLPREESLSLSIIGARECSAYGGYVARAFAKQAALAGAVVVSGMARGIDGLAQQAAIDAGGRTFGVLGCGVDVCYPAENRPLYEAMQKEGGVLSPYPPGTMPARGLFPYRNKVVAGLSDGVLVVEARQKSGTLITVDMALEQGKDVYAVPGRLTDRLSDGCNYLIRQGAGIALSPEDVLAELSVLKNRQGNSKAQKNSKVQESAKAQGNSEMQETSEAQGNSETQESVKAQKNSKVQESIKAQGNRTGPSDTESNEMTPQEGVIRFLDFNPLSSDEIYEKMQQAGEEITLPQLLFELIQLCMAGKARQISGNYFVKILR